VTVTHIDRLALSTFDLFAIVKQIVDAKAQFRSLAEPWADTGTQHRAVDDRRVGRTGGRGARPNPHSHRAEGRSRATKRGQRMGGKPKLTEAQQAEARRRARPSPNSRAATTWAYPPFGGRHAPPRFCVRPRQKIAPPIKSITAADRPTGQV
jgi:hypothetical protein